MRRCPVDIAFSLYALLILMVSTMIVCPTVTAQPRQLSATRAWTPVVIDGLHTDATWLFGDTSIFTQQSPIYNAAPSERTSIWITYDDDALYIAARMYDSMPSAIVRNVGGRDADVPADWLEVALDPAHDRRSGYYFRVTAAGGMADGTLYNETERDNSWNGQWESAVTIDSAGWVAEIRIPFSQLRYIAKQDQVWGINITRWIHRKQEEIVLAPAPRSIGASVAYFADLVGIEGIVPPVRMEFVPYAVSRLHSYEPVPENPLKPGRDFSADAGADLRIGIGTGLTFSTTVNPDFGQVEVDPASINLTTYETIFPEKRPFFTEGANHFNAGDENIGEFFYTRRIGRAPQGRPTIAGFTAIPTRTRILGAAKLYGQLADSISVGLLGAVTERTYARIDSAGKQLQEEIEPLAVYAALGSVNQFGNGQHGLQTFAAGVGRDLRTPSLSGIMNDLAVAGAITGWSYLDNHHDWSVRWLAGGSYVHGSREKLLRLQRAPQRYFQRPDISHHRIDTTLTSMTGWAGKLVMGKQEGNITGDITLSATSPEFELNDIGILRQADRLKASATLGYGSYEPDDLFLNWSFGATASREFDFARTPLGMSVSAYGNAEFSNAWGLGLSASYQPRGLDAGATHGGPAIESPAGWSGSISAYTDDRSGIMFWASGDASGDVEGANSYGIGGGVQWRPWETLMLSAGPWIDHGSWPTIYFTEIADPLAAATYGTRYVFARLRQSTISCDIRISWTLTPRLSFQLYLQPYQSHASYDGFKELLHPHSYAFHQYGDGTTSIAEHDGVFVIDPDADGVAPSFSLDNSDFDYFSLRGTAVLQWEYSSGSTIYLVWTQSRFVYNDYWTPETGPQLQRLFKSHPDDIFLLKVSYLLGE
jgi:hypothetical protein